MHNVSVAFPSSPDLIARRAKQLGLSQFDIGKAVGLSQGQVSRLLAGRAKRPGTKLDEICAYVYSPAHRSIGRSAVSKNVELMNALEIAWDGTPKHAKALAAVIRSLAVLRENT
jgi:transcriptional regulator with XRE-family HTH domain